MIIKSLVELEVASLLYLKLSKISRANCLNLEKDKKNKERFKRIYFFLLITSTIFGIVVFVFDFPWGFTDLQYYSILYSGVFGVLLLFIYSGIYLGDFNSINR